MKFLEFFSESNGQLSNARFNSTLLVLAGILYPYLSNSLTAETITYSFGLIGMGIGNKLISKNLENNNEKPA